MSCRCSWNPLARGSCESEQKLQELTQQGASKATSASEVYTEEHSSDRTFASKCCFAVLEYLCLLWWGFHHLKISYARWIFRFSVFLPMYALHGRVWNMCSIPTQLLWDFEVNRRYTELGTWRICYFIFDQCWFNNLHPSHAQGTSWTGAVTEASWCWCSFIVASNAWDLYFHFLHR